MTESMKAFEQHYKDFYDLPDTEFPKFNSEYTQSHQHREYAHWQAAEAYGRKVALEDVAKTYQDFAKANHGDFYRDTTIGESK